MNEKERPKCFGDWGENCYCKQNVECLVHTLKNPKIVAVEIMKMDYEKLKRNRK